MTTACLRRLAACGALVLLGSTARSQEGLDPNGVKARVAAFKLAMRDPHPENQRRAILQLAALSRPEVVKALAPYLAHPDDGVATTAARALSHAGWGLDARGRGVVVALLVKAIRRDAERRPEVAEQTVRHLRRLGDGRAVKPLIEQITAADAGVCWAAIDALGELRDLEAVDPLLKELQRISHGERPGDQRGWYTADPQRRERLTKTAEHIEGALAALLGTTQHGIAAWRKWWKANGRALRAQRRAAAAHRGFGRAPQRPPLYEPGRRLPGVNDPVRAVERACRFLMETAERQEAMRKAAGPGFFAVADDSLSLLALVHAGYAGDARVQRWVDALGAAKLPAHPGVYRIALQIMVLERANGRKYQEAIARRAWWLVHAQHSDGSWGYDGPDGRLIPAQLTSAQATRTRFPGVKLTGPGVRALDSRPDPVIELKHHGFYNGKWTDLSNTQFAVLGLHAAERAHVRCPGITWKRIEQLHVENARAEGWGYQPFSVFATPSMTAGGLSSLACVREVLQNDSPERSAVVKAAFGALGRTKLLRAIQVGKLVQRGQNLTGMKFFYWIWSLERACVLWNRARLGGRDWWAPIADVLVRIQKKDGSWGPYKDPAPQRGPRMVPAKQWSTGNPINTAFAVLFLVKASPKQRRPPTQITKGALPSRGDPDNGKDGYRQPVPGTVAMH